jgi:hypothetical protein
MKKIFNTILLLFIILGNVTAQNKKELNALVSKLRVDSASMKDEIKVLNSSISKLENDLILKKSQLSKKSIKIESLVSKNEKLKHSFDTSFKSNLFLRNQIHTQIIKYDSLKSQLELLQTNNNDLNNSYSAFNFKFPFDWECCNGINVPMVYPIGCSYDGKILYKQDHCDGFCGCCGTSLVVKDLTTNKIIKNNSFNTEEFYEEEIWDDQNYRESIIELAYNYNIIPLGFGYYDTSKIITIYKDEGEADQLKIIFDKKNGEYEIKSTKNGSSPKLEYVGNLTKNAFSETWDDVEYVGYFKSEINNYAAIVIMHLSVGFEAEGDYEVEFIGVKLK